MKTHFWIHRGGGLILLLIAGLAQAKSDPAKPIEGNHGQLYVQGSLTESACRLAMDSAWQEIDLGNIPTGPLRNIGDRGEPTQVAIRLEDCLPSPASTRDAWSGNRLWSREQPSVKVSFAAPSEPGSSELVQVSGASGLALRLTDRQNQSVRLNKEGLPMLLNSGDNRLFYYITPERTSTPLVAGTWHALIHFRLDYD